MGPIPEELYWGDTPQDKEDLLVGVEAWTGPRAREREVLELPVCHLASGRSTLGTPVCRSSRSAGGHRMPRKPPCTQLLRLGFSERVISYFSPRCTFDVVGRLGSSSNSSVLPLDL